VRPHPYRIDIQAATGSSFDGSGFLSVGVDGDAPGSTLPPAEAMYPLGLIAVPADPGLDADGNVLPAQTVTLIRLCGENTDAVIPCGDPRVTGKVPPGAKGSVTLYEPAVGPADVARVAINGDGTHGIVIHVAVGAKITIGVAGGPSVTVDGTTGNVELGGPSGLKVVVNPDALTASFTALQTALANAGITWTPPAGIAATKVTAV
jgi:hypothetical protein